MSEHNNIKGFYRINNNGHVSEGSITSENLNKIDKRILRELTSADRLFDAIFQGTPLAILASEAPNAPRYNKEDCDSDFPPSSKIIRKDKSIIIPVAATGCSDDDVTVELVGDKIHVQFHRKPQDYDAVLYTQRGLKLPTDESINFPFKPMYYDPAKITATVENGLLLIELQPRDEIKPVNKVLLGSKKAEQEEE